MTRVFSKRPAAFSCAAFLLCLFAGTYFASCLKWIAAAILLPLGILFLILSQRRKALRLWALLPLAAALALMLSYCSVDLGYKRDAERYEGDGICTFTVTKSVKNDPYYAVYEITLDTICDEKTDLRAELVTAFDASYKEGSRYRADLSLTGAQRYAIAKGFSLSCYQKVSDAEFLESGVSDFPHTAIAKIHGALSVRLRAYLDPESAGIAEALLDGERDDLPGRFTRPFRQLGLSHLLAISGLHLSVLFGLAAYLLKKAGASFKARIAVLTPLLLCYIFLTDFAPSVIRASFMLLFTYFASFAGRKSDPVTSLLMSVSLICLLSPRSVMDTGLELSFFATLGIILTAIPVTERLPEPKNPLMKVLNAAASAVLITGAAVLYTLPVSALTFGSVSWVSIFTNLLFTIPVTLLLVCILPFAVFSFLPAAAPIFAYPVRFLSHFLIGAADHLATPRALCKIEGLPLFLLLAFGIIAVILFLCLRKTAWTYSVLALVMIPLLIVNAAEWKRTDESAAVFYVSENANDAICLENGDRLLVVDISGGTYRFFADTLEKAQAQDKKVSILFTHYHNAAPYALSRLSGKYDCEMLYLSPPSANGENGYDALRRYAQGAGMRICELSEDRQMAFTDTEITVTSEENGQKAHPDITVRVKTPEKTYYYTTGSGFDEEITYIYGSHDTSNDAIPTPSFRDLRKIRK